MSLLLSAHQIWIDDGMWSEISVQSARPDWCPVFCSLVQAGLCLETQPRTRRLSTQSCFPPECAICLTTCSKWASSIALYDEEASHGLIFVPLYLARVPCAPIIHPLIHPSARGLKLGIYTSKGPFTCLGYQPTQPKRPGSCGFEQIDADTYAHDWQADQVKDDGCGQCPQHNPFVAMRDALNRTGRKIFYAIHSDGKPWEAASDSNGTVANMWRTGGDLSGEPQPD